MSSLSSLQDAETFARSTGADDGGNHAIHEVQHALPWNAGRGADFPEVKKLALKFLFNHNWITIFVVVV